MKALITALALTLATPFAAALDFCEMKERRAKNTQAAKESTYKRCEPGNPYKYKQADCDRHWESHRRAQDIRYGTEYAQTDTYCALSDRPPVRIGNTAAEVRASNMGLPHKVSEIVSSAGISETWHYFYGNDIIMTVVLDNDVVAYIQR